MSDAQIMVQLTAHEALLRVSGRATFVLGGKLREFGQRTMGTGVNRFLVDMHECCYMDSTFMGVLAMLALETRENGGSVALANLGGNVNEQLAELGLKKLFSFPDRIDFEADWKTLTEGTDPAAAGKGTMKRTMLDAHRTLGEVSRENVARFKDVVQVMEQDLRREST